MTALNYANLWSSELTGAITNSALSCGVISTAGSPAVPFRARIRAEGANKDEIVTVTAKTGTLTGPDSGGYYTLNATNAIVPANATMLTLGSGRRFYRIQSH